MPYKSEDFAGAYRRTILLREEAFQVKENLVDFLLQALQRYTAAIEFFEKELF